MKKALMLAAVAAAVALTAVSALGVSAADEVRMRAELSATPAGGLASGHADFRQRASETRLSVEVEDVSVNGNGTVVVKRGAATLLTRSIRIRLGFGDLNLRSGVPTLAAGDTVEVYDANGALILTGSF
jgi:hypothetical protein